MNDKHDAEYISRRALADLLEWVPSSVIEMCQQGKISVYCPCPGCGSMQEWRTQTCAECDHAVAGLVNFSQGKVHRTRAFEEIERHRAPEKAHVTERWADQRGDQPTKMSDQSSGKVLSYQEAKTKRETFAAAEAELDYLERARTVCLIADVEREAADLAAALHNRLLQIPSQIAPIVAAETDEHKTRLLLEDEIERILEEFTLSEAATRLA